MIRVGLVSDTHGLLRPGALAFLRDSDHLVHAGDICDGDVLASLRTLGPLTAVRGNNDHGAWADALPRQALLRLGEVQILVIHDLAELDLGGLPAGVRVVVSGHSHRPGVEWRGGRLFVNPGSAGPRRFSLPISVGELQIDGAAVEARTVVLSPG